MCDLRKAVKAEGRTVKTRHDDLRTELWRIANKRFAIKMWWWWKMTVPVLRGRSLFCACIVCLFWNAHWCHVMLIKWPLTEVRNWSSWVFAALSKRRKLLLRLSHVAAAPASLPLGITASLPFEIEFQLCMWPVCWSWEGLTALFVPVCACVCVCVGTSHTCLMHVRMKTRNV